jgi:hypothetical protein
MRAALVMHGKQFWAKAAAIAAPIIWICGAIVDVPQAMSYLIDRGPEWIKNPSVLWFLTFVSIESAVIFWIWKQPAEPERKRDALTDQMMKLMEDASPRQCRLMTFLSEVRCFERSVAETQAEPASIQYDLNMLRVVFPSRIAELLGDDFRKKYIETLEHSIKESKNLGIVTQTVVPLLSDKIVDVLIDDTDRQVAAAQKRIENKSAVVALPSPKSN